MRPLWQQSKPARMLPADNLARAGHCQAQEHLNTDPAPLLQSQEYNLLHGHLKEEILNPHV